MIRALLLLIVFALGLVAAAVFYGQMYHLRMSVPRALPGWTSMISEKSSLQEGRLTLPAQGRIPKLDLIWTARAPSRAGWVWDVQLTGDGVALDGQAVLAFWPDELLLVGTRGSVDLGRIKGVPVPVRGILSIEKLTGTVASLLSTPAVTGNVSGTLPSLQIDGVDAGSGPLTGALGAGGDWQADLKLDGGVSPAVVRVDGDVNSPQAMLELDIADGAGLPPTLRAMLSAVARAEGQGWNLSLPVQVP